MNGDNGPTTAVLEPEVLDPDRQTIAVPSITNAEEIESAATRYALEAATDLQLAQAVQVTDDESYAKAGELRIAIDRKRKGGEGVVELICGPLYAKWKAFRGLLMAPVETRALALKVLSGKRLIYEQKKEAEAEAERKRREEAARVEQDRLNRLAEQRAERAEAKGDTERAEEIRATVPIVPVPVGRGGTVLTKTKGIAKTVYWHAALVGVTEEAQRESLKRLVTAVAAGEVPLDAVCANLPWLNKTAKALQKNMQYPGVVVWSDTQERSTGR